MGKEKKKRSIVDLLYNLYEAAKEKKKEGRV